MPWSRIEHWQESGKATKTAASSPGIAPCSRAMRGELWDGCTELIKKVAFCILSVTPRAPCFAALYRLLGTSQLKTESVN